MRVLFVTNMWPDDERPWHGTFVKVLADSLELRGIAVDVLHIRGWASKAEYARRAVDVARLNGRPNTYDIVHAHYGHSGVIARLQVRAPLVISYCGDDLLGTVMADGRRSRGSLAAARAFAELARVSAATITRTAEMERKLPVAASKRNEIIPSPVDLDHFSPGPRNEARRELGWDDEEVVALFVGDPGVPVKDFPLARAACERARSELPGLRLRAVSSEPHDRIPLYLRASDALIFTSRSEGSPNAVKEAMACELPVVATPVGDVPERLAGVESCFMCPFDPVELAEGLAAAVRHGRSPEARLAVEPLGLVPTAERVAGVYARVAR